jgi:hypothetical protein
MRVRISAFHFVPGTRRETNPIAGMMHQLVALCSVSDSHQVSGAPFESQKLVESGTLRFNEPVEVRLSEMIKLHRVLPSAVPPPPEGVDRNPCRGDPESDGAVRRILVNDGGDHGERCRREK